MHEGRGARVEAVVGMGHVGGGAADSRSASIGPMTTLVVAAPLAPSIAEKMGGWVMRRLSGSRYALTCMGVGG